MIESKDPEINIDELIQKIVEQVSKSQVHSQLVDSQSNLDISKLKLSISHLETLLKNAESRSSVRTKWPEKLNLFPFNFSAKLQKLILKVIDFLFKDQREVNFNIINSLKESVALNHQLIEQIANLKEQVSNSIQGVDERFVAVDNRLVTLDNSNQGLDERLIAMNSSIQELDRRLVAMDSSIQGIDARIERVDEHLITTDSRIITANTRIQEINERYIRNDSYLKNDLMQQKRLTTMFLEEARKRLPEPFSQEQLETFVNEDMHLLDAFYVAFEEPFRASRESILNRLKVYLPLIAEAKTGKLESPILDVGCGRGEWLELLQETGYTARGLDINRIMVEQCKARGLEVIEKNALSYLQSLPDSSLGAVTGFHIIEHLPFEDLLKLFGEAARVLQTGGLVIFETPNPENILVGSCNFYYDPTHRNPLPPLTIEYIAQSYGFSRVQILKLNPSEHNIIADNSELAQRFNEYFYGSMDYAVIGFKP